MGISEQGGDVGAPPSGGQTTGFGDYEFLSMGKAGGMGVVYRARQISLNRIVGLKMIRAGNLATAKEVQRFQTEAEAAASLDHPHIVPIYEVGEHEGRHYFTMKWIEGESLADAVKRSGAGGADPASVRMVAKIACAVQHAHERGILHRDLKPANILIDGQGEPHVTDFGLAKRLESDVEATATGVVMGTPYYMSPEQAKGKNKELTTASDIFSLGAILYHLLTGRVPFPGSVPYDIIQRVIEQEPARPSALNPGIDRDLETICLKCLLKDPPRRYGSARALATDLENWLEGKPVQARPVSDWERSWKWVRRHPAVSSLSGAVMLSVLLGLIGVSAEWRQAERERSITADTNVRLELERAEDFFSADKADLAVATLSRMVREDPKNRVAAERLINALGQSVFFVPVRPAAPQDQPAARLTVPFIMGDKPDDLRKRWAGLPSLAVGAITSDLLTFLEAAHTQPIRSIGVSPDGERVITASSDSTARIWNAHTHALVHTLEHHSPVYWAEFSPDGSNVATATAQPDCEARLWDAGSGTAAISVLPMRHLRGVNSARFSPSGDLVATGSDDKTARLWLSSTGKPFSEPVRLAKAVDDVRFRSGGRALVLTLEDNQTRTYRFTPGTVLFRASDSEIPTREAVDSRTQALDSFKRRLSSQHSGPITCLDINSNLNLLASASIDKSARLWDLRGLQPVAVPMIHESTVNCVRFSPDGLRLATSTADPTRVRLWDALTGQPLSHWIESPAAVAAVDFSADSGWIIASAGWKWPVQRMIGAPPAWLPELGEAIAGVRYTARGLPELVPDEEFFKLEAMLLRSTATNGLVRWAQDVLGTEGESPK